MLGGWRLLRCNPFSHGGYDPVEDAAPLQPAPPDPARLTAMTSVLANILQPLIDIFDRGHRVLPRLGRLELGAVDHRADRRGPVVLAAADRQAVQVDAALQRLAPQIKELQEKYKDDKQRLNQEMMKFYRENKVNPLGSCLPLVLQLPVFISLFYMLRRT